MNEKNLSKKALKNLHRLRLENMLKVKLKNNQETTHTFYKMNGIILEPEQTKKYKISELEKEIITIDEGNSIIITNEQDFLNHLEEYLKKHNISNEEASLKQTAISTLIKELISAQIDYEKVISNNPYLKTDIKLLNTTGRYITFLRNLSTEMENYIPEVKSEYPSYVEVGALFAQGFILKDKETFFYRTLKFTTCSALSIYIKNEVLNTENSVRQYVNDTINGHGQKNFTSNKTMMKNIVNFCKSKGYNIKKEFEQYLIDLEQKH